MERKTRLSCRCHPSVGLALALFALFAWGAMTAQAMLLTLELRWDAPLSTTDPDSGNPIYSYNLQEGSIVQVIGYQASPSTALQKDVGSQFGDENGKWYGTTSDTTHDAAPYNDGEHVPGDKQVWLADNTQDGHDILYTGTIQQHGSGANLWYGVYTQITVDSYMYDTVYIRVFGATEFTQGEAVASYWGVSDAQTLHPSYATDTLLVHNQEAGNLNYFEVIPEPATLGLLGVGGIALAALRRRRFARTSEDAAEREED